MAFGVANVPPRRGIGVKTPDPKNRIHPSGSRPVCSGASREMPGRLCSTGLPNCSATSGGDRLSAAAVRWRRSRCGGKRSKSRPASTPQEDRRSRLPRLRAPGWHAMYGAARQGRRTGVCAPGPGNRTEANLSERPGWPGADMAGRSVLRISDPGDHAVRVRAALTVCLCAGFLYAKGVPPRARPSAGWWLSAPIFRNTHNPDRRAPCRSVDGPPQE